MPKRTYTFVPGWENAPTEPGVYMLYCDDVCLYVGSAMNLRARVKSHPKREGVTSFRFIICAVADLAKIEQQQIDRLHPTLNKAKAYRPGSVPRTALFRATHRGPITPAEVATSCGMSSVQFFDIRDKGCPGIVKLSEKYGISIEEIVRGAKYGSGAFIPTFARAA